MTKEVANDIALAMIAKSGAQFDDFAFDGSDIPEKDKDKIFAAIQYQCSKIINKIEAKYDIAIRGTTAEIIEQIVYES